MENPNCFIFMFVCFVEIDPELIDRFIGAGERGDSIEIAKVLDVGMPVDICDEYGQTAFTWAAVNNHVNATYLLLQRGVEVNKQDEYGETALHHAACNNSIDTIRVLMQHGASTNIKNKNCLTPVDWARMRNSEEALRLLEQH